MTHEINIKFCTTIFLLDALFCLSAIGNILKNQNCADNVPFVITDRCATISDGYFRPVSGYQHRMICQLKSAPSENPCCKILHLFAGFPIYNVEYIFQWLSGSTFLFPAGQFLGSRIHERYTAPGIGCDHGIADTPKSCGKPFLALL